VHARRIGVGPAASVAALLVIALGVAAAVRATGFLPRDRAHAARSTGTTVTAAAAAPAAHAVAVAPPAHHRRRRLQLPADLPARKLELPILTYHRIDRPAPREPAMERRLTVAPADFAAQMRWLAAHGYHGVTERQVYDAVAHGRELPPRPVLVTFDDGYRDVLTYAVPVLERLHFPATAFVITNRTGDGAGGPWLTWADLHRMERLGLDVGSHTVSHRNLTALPPAAARDELVRSRRALELHLGHPVQWFAYPFGGVDGPVAALTRQAGYVLAVTTRPGRVQDGSRPLELHRDEVLDTTGVAGVAALVGG
jgi:peptidoglycan/xylan/chitin deacetylase (PgdA/CDA1 family)